MRYTRHMRSLAKTPDEYIASLPEDRRAAVQKLRDTIRANIDPKFKEEMSYGMIGYVVPLSIFPEGYHCDPTLPVPFLSLANQKNYIALYHMALYADATLLEWFQEEYDKTGFKLDMGKSCIRFKKTRHIPYGLIAELVRRVPLADYLDTYIHNIRGNRA